MSWDDKNEMSALRTIRRKALQRWGSAILAMLSVLLFSFAHAQPVWQTSATAVGSGGTATVAAPSGTVAGDLLIVGIMLEKGSDVAITATGWTLVRRTNNGTDAGMATYWKWAGSSEPASYSFTLTNSPKWSVGVSRITGADTTTPIDISGGTTGGSGNVTAPSVNTTVADALVLAFYTNKKPATYTAAGGTDERYDAPNTSGGLPSNMMATFVQASAGATGNKAATPSESEKWAGQQVAVRPVPVVPTPGSFNAFETNTSAGAITGVIKTKIAGNTFKLDVVAIQSGAQLTGFNDNVSLELLGNNTLGVALDANNCPTSFTTLQTISPFAISGGRSEVTFAAVPNSWRDVRVRIRWPTSSPTVTSCSTDNFALRPEKFTNLAANDNDWETAGTARTLNNRTVPGGVVHKAGRPFTLSATAENKGGATSTNYAETPTAVLTDCGKESACLSSGFGTFTIGASFAAGQLNSNLATYSEVGSFSLELQDLTFASVDASDGSTTNDREIKSNKINVGRFVPDHFAVTLNTPIFATACPAGSNSFTYVGQSLTYTTAPIITVTAQNFSNGTTVNYADVLWQITNASLTGKSYTAASGTINTSGLPGTDPVIVASGSGIGTLTFGSGLSFTRSTPVAPFDADISLAINVIDADGVAYASNPARFAQATAGNGIAFDDGDLSTTNDKQMRFGRLALRNANGSQLVSLPAWLETHYWASTQLGFITNTADSCTSIANNNVAMSSFAGNLVACETALSGGGTFSSGRRTMLLAAPGNTNDGSVILTANLTAAASGTTCTTVGGATVPAAGANRAYLQGNWSGANYDQNPAARATFGVFKGAEEVIFIRENF
jgi:MSHA biogenesis protein MshQ